MEKELIRQIGRYRLWLQDNRLYSDDISERIHEGLRLLVEDELIYALFFSDFGQRMLSSQAGRTTMCPTELFFDRNHQENYLLLLPIETRVGELSLQQLRGLRILDTPGLNALGSEPELTISLLPKAHAIIFVLSADKARLRRLAEKTQTEYEFYHKKLIILRSSRRLVEAQGVTLQELLPVMQYTLEQKQLLQHQIGRFRTIKGTGAQ